MSHLNPLISEGEANGAASAGFPTTEELALLWRIGLFSSDDGRALRRLWRVLKGQTDDYLE